MSGVVATSTAYGLQVAQASEVEKQEGAGERVTVGMGVVVAGVVLGAALGL